MQEKLILITNDDGYQSKGLKALVDIAKPFGKIVVLAPDRARSAQSSALTVTKPILIRDVEGPDGVRVISCTGTPSDCVKLAFSKQIPGLSVEPDLLLSGINHGSNTSINVIYSGTIGAAIEGALHNKSSIGFSFCDHSEDADFSYCTPFFSKIIENVITNGMPPGICLNVNAPTGKIKGIKACRQEEGSWNSEFMASSTPYCHDCYWLAGSFYNKEHKQIGTDGWAIENGYISVQPVQTDLTDYKYLEELKEIDY